MAELHTPFSGKSTAFGTWVALDSPVAAEIVARAGYDFVIVDTQHSEIALDTSLPLLQVFDAHRVPALVRVGWSDPRLLMRAADFGAAGIVVPMISTPDEARRAAMALRYAPDGNRSFGPVRSYYAASDNPKPLCLIMIETAEALDNLDAIAATPGVDGLLLGPVDLALALGLGLAFEMPPRIFEAVDAIVAACRKHGILSASAALGMDNARDLMNHGVELIAADSDNQMVRRGAAEAIARFKSWTDTEPRA